MVTTIYFEYFFPFAGMKIYAVDVSGENTNLNDDSMIDKYEMPDDEYNKREGFDISSLF